MHVSELDSLREAAEACHGSKAAFFERTPIREVLRGRTVWEGKVLVFALRDHPTANVCYAWSVDGRVTAVLHEPPVDSPQAAVRAAIVQEHRERNRETK